MDLTSLVETDPLLSSALPETRYYYAPGKIAGLNTAVEATLLFYNRALFDQAGIPYPPSDPGQAWTWDAVPGCSQKADHGRQRQASR